MKIHIKTDEEIKIMKESGEILKKTQEKLKKYIQKGVTLIELDKIAEDTILSSNAIPSFKNFPGFKTPFPASICTMVNDEVVHGIPSEKKLKNGDLLSIDCGVKLKNLHTDAAFSVIVGGNHQNPQRANFSACVKDALKKACEIAVPGNFLGDLGHIIEKTVKSKGYSVCKEYTGHGIGYQLHEDPFVLNFGKPKTGHRLIAGMTIAIEPIIAAGSPQVKTLDDGWTVLTVDGKDACQWEYCGVVTPQGLDIFA